MIEFDRNLVDEKQSVHIETFEVARQHTERFFLNEDMTILVACNAGDSAGQIQFLSGIEQILDYSICYIDPSSADIVKVSDLDPTVPQRFNQKDIIRLRYISDDIVEEAHFVHRNSLDKKNKSKITCTTPRMRKIMQQDL
jgi:hypothetical protein